VFSKKHGTTHGHLYRVLTGKRQSKTIVDAYAAFLREQKIDWPAAAKVKPTATHHGKKHAA
jgi:hypothetical protein